MFLSTNSSLGGAEGGEGVHPPHIPSLIEPDGESCADQRMLRLCGWRESGAGLRLNPCGAFGRVRTPVPPRIGLHVHQIEIKNCKSEP